MLILNEFHARMPATYAQLVVYTFKCLNCGETHISQITYAWWLNPIRAWLIPGCVRNLFTWVIHYIVYNHKSGFNWLSWVLASLTTGLSPYVLFKPLTLFSQLSIILSTLLACLLAQQHPSLHKCSHPYMLKYERQLIYAFVFAESTILVEHLSAMLTREQSFKQP